VKHHLHGKSSQEIGDLMQSLSNGELVALLKDFKVPCYHKRKKLKACEMIEEFKKHREDGYPQLKRKLMTPAQRIAADREKETPEERRARQEADALRHAERRANETPEETRARQQADALQRSEARMKEKDSTRSRWPSDDTTPWMQPGKDYILDLHEESPETTQHLFYDASGKGQDRVSSCNVAYTRVHRRLEKTNNISSLDKLVGFCKIHIEGGKNLFESITLAVPEENIRNEFEQWVNEDENRSILNLHEARFEWFATTNVISLEDCKTRIVTVNWFESLIGLKLIVPGHWWNNCKAEDKSKLWRCEIESIDYHDAAERYFKIKCEDDQYPDARYEMSYKGVLKYMDVDQDGFSSFDLREQVPYFDPEYVAMCEENQKLLNYIESNPSYDDEKKRYVDVIDVVTFLYSYIVSHDLFVILL
jgi:hypothetical protein